MFRFYFKLSEIFVPAIAFALLVSLIIIITGNKNSQFTIDNANSTNHPPTKSFLIKGKNKYAAVSTVDATVTHELALIDTIAVSLTKQQFQQISNLDVQITPNYSVNSSGLAWGQRISYSQASAVQMSNAEALHNNYIFGDGVTIAVVDSGFKSLTGLRQDAYGRNRVYGTYDAIENKIANNYNDGSGHGTHVASLASNSERDAYGRYYGLAPNARLISIKAFNDLGKGNYADIIRGIEWAITYKDAFNIRVLNLSFSAEPRSLYWHDPLNQAVMRAWQAGIVIVTSAGNRGNSPMGIGVPGNIPYVITVGAVTDNYTPNDFTDDRLATFSASGPTYERFVKPEIVAPGGHMMGLMESKTELAKTHPEYHDGGQYFQMSGTSQATAVVSGIVALMLNRDANLTPDDIKCRLMNTAKPARNASGDWAYSIFEQGMGQVDALAAVNSNAAGCANNGLNIAEDLEDRQHFAGPTILNEKGQYNLKAMSNWLGLD